MDKLKFVLATLLVVGTISACDSGYQGIHTTLDRSQLPYSGTILPPAEMFEDNTEFFVINSISGDGLYRVNLTPTNYDLDLGLYMDGSFQTNICASWNPSTQAESCDLFKPWSTHAGYVDSSIFVDVQDVNGLGDSFTLDVVVYYEGSSQAPFVVDSTTAANGLFSGTDAYSFSFYKITGLTPSTPYNNILIDLPTSDVQYQIYDDLFVTAQAGGNAVIAANSSTPFAGTPDANGDLFIKIWENTAAVDLSSYTLSVNP